MKHAGRQQLCGQKNFCKVDLQKFAMEEKRMKRVFEKNRLGNLELKNRLVRSATWEGIATPDGRIGSAVKAEAKR